jgi:UDP-N-acetylmuramoyl-tripeptide--D-alanyl-D-alanine ligase
MNLKTIAALFSTPCAQDVMLTGISTDTRQLERGNLFIALAGERLDAHHFVTEAEAKGAAAVLVARQVAGLTIPQLVVADTLMALAKIAKAHRQTIHCPVIALTGSNGKTSVKEMIAAILPKPSLATHGNLNNHIGAPLSVLRLEACHRYAVFELGANHPGEIAHTVDIVAPHVALINNIAPAHVEGFGSIEGVATAKGEIYQGLSSEGIAIINDDDNYAHFWDKILLDKKCLRFSIEHPTDVFAQNIHFDARGCGSFSLCIAKESVLIKLNVPGLHNVRNALAAAACCYALHISLAEIQAGLQQFSGVKGRLSILRGKNQATLIDDSYNANLRSVLAALEVLGQCPGKRVFVFGDMGELGQWSNAHHEEVGLAARRLGIDQVLTVGSFSRLASEAFGPGGTHYSSQEELLHDLTNTLHAEVTVLIKGSRASAMEKIVSQLLQ